MPYKSLFLELLLFVRDLLGRSVALQVRKLRMEQKMSQQTLSDRLETMAIYICRGSISRIEDKQRTVTDIELYGLAKVLGVSIEDLFEE